MENLVGQVFRVAPSVRDGKLLAYAPSGKIILVANPDRVKPGYAKVITYTDKSSVIMATMQNVDGVFEKDLVGETFRIKPSKRDGRLVGRTDEGKRILVMNEAALQPGYAKILEYNEKPNVILARMENVDCDYFKCMAADAFYRILRSKGFVLEYSEPVYEQEDFQVWANLNEGTLVTLETWLEDRQIIVANVVVYVPCKYDILKEEYLEEFGFVGKGKTIRRFNLFCSEKKFPLDAVLRLRTGGKNWNGDVPLLVTDNTERNEDGDVDWDMVSQKVFAFRDDLNTAFNFGVEMTLVDQKVATA